MWQTHKPDDTPVNGHLSTSEARNVPWWTLPGCSSCSVDAAARAVWQDGMPACNRRRALQIRRYDPPTFVALSEWSSAARVLPTRVEGLSRNLMDGSTAGPQRERPLSSPNSSIVGTFDPIAFGPSVASLPPCNWRRPSLAVAGAGIAEARSVAANRLGSVK